jgi:hypothetical protein
MKLFFLVDAEGEQLECGLSRGWITRLEAGERE